MITRTKEIHNQRLSWKSHIDCILELWRYCTHRLPVKWCYSKLRTLYWNPKKSQKTHNEEGAEIYDILPQQDNSRPHNSAATTVATAYLGFTVISYPAYSPDLALSDLHLFPKLKETTGVKTSVLMKKSRLQYASGFGRQEKTVLRTEFKTC